MSSKESIARCTAPYSPVQPRIALHSPIWSGAAPYSPAQPRIAPPSPV